MDRGGIAPLRTAEELARIIPLVVLLIVDGHGGALFPDSTPAAPSPWVCVVLTRKSLPGFPLYVHWRQWEALVVPILKEIQTSGWRGSLGVPYGEILTLLNNVFGPTGEILYPEGTPYGTLPYSRERVGKLYACDWTDIERVVGKTAQYLREVSLRVYDNATSLGY